MLEVKLEDRKLLPLVLEKIGSALSALDKEALAEEFKLRLEKRSLFLRLDKQSAYLGTLKLGSNDPIRFKIHFKNKTPQEIEDLSKQAGLLP
jgi:RNA binding exosome subunit